MERFFLHFSNIGMFCLVIVAFFVLVATEYSLLNCRSGLIEEEESEHKFGASAALLLLRQLEKSILTVQFLIILFSIFLGWWGSGIIDFYVKRIFSKIVQDWPILSSSIFTLLISFIAMLYLIMVFGWLISKSVAAKYPEKTLRFFALPVLCCVWLFTPILFIIMGSANLILKCFGLSTEVEPSKVHSPEELAELVTQSTESGELGKEEEEMLHGVIGLSDTVAREVMTPRTDLVTVPINAS